MKGSSAKDRPGTYGTRGVPAPGNTPGARIGGVSWADSAGGLWLFGGMGYDGAGNVGDLNDLWKFDITTGTWTWMKGSSMADLPPFHGTLSVPAPTVTPGGRWSAISWTGRSGSLWLYGGRFGDTRKHEDLWKFDPLTGNWTWMKGTGGLNEPPIYGTQGIPAPENKPGARADAVAWTGSEGGLWLFGGHGWRDDLWRYDSLTGNWTWMKGSSTFLQWGTYGTQGIPAPGNTPGALRSALSWIDRSDALWLFGGQGWGGFWDNGIFYDGGIGRYNDLWRFDIGGVQMTVRSWSRYE
jgi:hypothetical protein